MALTTVQLLVQQFSTITQQSNYSWLAPVYWLLLLRKKGIDFNLREVCVGLLEYVQLNCTTLEFRCETQYPRL